MDKISFFKGSELLNDDFSEIYNKIKLLNKRDISKEIDANYERFGLEFLNAIIINSILDIDSDESPNQIISYIDKYSQNVINKLKRRNFLNNLINLGKFGLLLLALLVISFLN